MSAAVLVVVTVEVPDEFADPNHDTGLSEDGYMALTRALAGWPIEDVEVLGGPRAAARSGS